MKPCPHPGCRGTLSPTGYCRLTGEPVDAATQRHSSVVAPRTPPSVVPPASSPPPDHGGAGTAPRAAPRDPYTRTRLPRTRLSGIGPPPRASSPKFTTALVRTPPENPEPTTLPEITLPRRTDADADPAAADPGRAARLPLPPGELLAGQYRLVKPLGYGGLGEVFLALDTKVGGREVAIKILLRRDDDIAGTAARHTLERERRALVELNHDAFIRVHNYGHHPDVGDFLVLQYADGLNLEEVRARAARHPEEFDRARYHEFVLGYGIRVLAGLRHLHAPGRGKVYGDLKPTNVMHDGASTKLIDVASVRESGAPGEITPGYHAPTVGAHGESTSRDDLFSLGMTLRSLSGIGIDNEPEDRARLRRLGTLGPDGTPSVAAPRAMSEPPGGLGLVSLARALYRATESKPADRFATAQEMEEQLRGVFRELRSLRTGEETFEPSPLFLLSAHALDGGLGDAPHPSHWAVPPTAVGPAATGSTATGTTATRPEAPTPEAPTPEAREPRTHASQPQEQPKAAGRPQAPEQQRAPQTTEAPERPRTPQTPQPPQAPQTPPTPQTPQPPQTPPSNYPPPTPLRIAQQLPVPRPSPDDPHHGELSRLKDDAPEALLQHVSEWRDSAEIHLLRCRLRLRTIGRPDGDDAARLESAARELTRAAAAIGPRDAPHDWRLDWHHGLLALAGGQIGAARNHFDRVYSAIPGEYAPKLALGYCAEHGGRGRQALTFYEAVRLRNPSLGSAAFGAVRARLALGGPEALAYAMEALDAVPQHSPHRTPARTAALRVWTDHARTAEDLAEALRRLSRLCYAHGLTDEPARVRMKAEVWGAAHRLVGAEAMTPRELERVAHEADPRIQFPYGPRDLRKDLAQLYQRLAHQAARTDAPDGGPVAALILDRAYVTRPYALRHHRYHGGTRWTERISTWWTRTTAPARPEPPSPSK
ncbi:tetratricopeptide repeat protein [Streptomyces sp. NPDC059009]|uniref:tetratricopeptide repeat protein n=1 Tax=Streptomyces sp. NPDC059009 TaxID=3346694 RepID=UPI0036BD2E24